MMAKEIDRRALLLRLERVGSFRTIAAVTLAFIAALAPNVVAQDRPIDGGTHADWPHYGGTQSA